jgi:crossover junction endodeoxyribonuclease RuvC
MKHACDERMQRHEEIRARKTHTVSTNNWHQNAPRLTLFAMSESAKRRTVFRVLGVDPAAAGPTGYGIVESDGRNCRMVQYGALKVAEKRKESPGAALEAVHTLICGLLRDFSPDALAVESIFSALNVKTALRLAEVRGVVLLAAAQHGVTVHSYAPRLVKASVAGYGNADKRHVQEMVRSLLQMSEIPEPADAADALAVALCHMQNEQFRRRFALPAIPGNGTSRTVRARGGATYGSNAQSSRVQPAR